MTLSGTDHAIWLWPSQDVGEPSVNGNRFGGLPNLPEEIDWPYFDNDYELIRVPLHFVLQLDFATIPRFDTLPDMPRSGTLFLFICPAFAPAYDYNQGSRVIFVPGDVSQAPLRPMPPTFPLAADTERGRGVSSQYAQHRTAGYKEQAFQPITFYRNPALTGGQQIYEKIKYAKSPDASFEHRSKSFQSMFIGPDGGPLIDKLTYGSAYDFMNPETAIPLFLLHFDGSVGFQLNYLAMWITPEDLAAARFDRTLLQEY